MKKQTKQAFIAIGTIASVASIFTYYIEPELLNLSGLLIGLSVIVLAFYDEKKNDGSLDKE